jgi:microcystin-dependent protein
MNEPYVGEIRMMTGPYAPQNWALCDGQLRNTRDYELLFNLIGTTYGGDGKTTFGLPNLEPYQGVKFYISMFGAFPRPN